MQKKQTENCPVCRKTSIGGQALIEGIMMRGPSVTAMAVRDPEGNIVLERSENTKKKVFPIFKWPLIRGIYGMITSFLLGYKCLMRSAEIAGLEDEVATDAPKEPSSVAGADEKNNEERAEKPSSRVSTENTENKEEKSQEKKNPIFTVIMVLGTVLGILLSVGLFIYLPKLLFNLIFEQWIGITKPAETAPYGDRYLYQMLISAFTGVLKIAIFVGYMAAVSLMKDIKRTFMYHGAEHKTIFCYEQGLPLTVENIRRQSRFHPRCGTSFMIIMLIISIVIGFFVPLCADWLYVTIKILLVPVAVGVGYEFIKFAGRHDTKIVRILSAPGLWMQRISTREPTDDMIECAIAAMKEVIPSDGSDCL